jgi:hypothetical protein
MTGRVTKKPRSRASSAGLPLVYGECLARPYQAARAYHWVGAGQREEAPRVPSTRGFHSRQERDDAWALLPGSQNIPPQRGGSTREAPLRGRPLARLLRSGEMPSLATRLPNNSTEGSKVGLTALNRGQWRSPVQVLLTRNCHLTRVFERWLMVPSVNTQAR